VAGDQFSVQDKRVTVVGAARSGLAAAKLLARKGARVTLSEMRTDVPEADALKAMGVAIEAGGHKTDTLASADLVVLSPGVPPELPAIRAARERGVPVIGEVELQGGRWRKHRTAAQRAGRRFDV
jgi:UDP-N-acetylmuramoylalanine--D-glutamate ligase